MNKSIFTKLIKKYNSNIVYSTLSGTIAVLDEESMEKLSNDKLEGLEEAGLLFDPLKEKINLLSDFKYIREDTTETNYTILLTYNCNLECIYCYEGERKNNKFMDENTCLKVIDFILNDIKSKKSSKVNIMFYGGEPLLNIKCIELLGENLKYRLNKLGIEFSSSMISNGINLSLDIIEKLKLLNLYQIQITLDGPKEIHDSRRCSKNNISYFNTILENIKNASRYFKVILRINFDRQNFKTITSLIDDIAYLANENIIMKFAPTYDLCNKYECSNEFVLTSVETAKNINYLTDYCFNKGFNIDNDILGTRLCGAYCKSELVIDPNGDLYKCIGYVGMNQYIIGNIFSDSRYENNELFKTYITTSPWKNKKCDNCEFLPICGSGCRYHATVLGKSLDEYHCKKEYYSELYKELIKIQYFSEGE